jgi:hypothetical protein
MTTLTSQNNGFCSIYTWLDTPLSVVAVHGHHGDIKLILLYYANVHM